MAASLEWVDALEQELLGGGRYADPLALGQTLDPPRIGIKGRRAGVRRSPVLDLICKLLVDLANGDNDRAMVFVPPQEGKSTTVAQWFPLWLLARDPSLKIAIMSHSARLARKRGKWIRQQIVKHPELGVELVRGSAAAEDWETAAGGGVRSVGIDGGITGDPVDVLIIDDPVRGRAEAESKTYRETAWDWWENNGSTRASDRFVCVLIMTRWHTDDLAGRLQKEEPGDWRVLSVSAIAEPGIDDPLGREPGEEIPSVQNRPRGWFHKLAKLRSPYVWLSIFQQRPTAAKGNLFKRDAWRYWEKVHHLEQGIALRLDGQVFPLQECWRFATVDLATSTKTSADYTVATAWAITPSQDLVVLDRWRGRVTEANHFDQAVRPLVEKWLQPGDVVHVEASQHGTTLVYSAGQAGIPIEKLEADTDKLTRALPAAGLQQAGRMWLPKSAEWLDDWIDEHADFPSVAHDDQVDNSGYAARVYTTRYVGPGESPEQAQARIQGSVLPDEMTPTGIDLMTAPW